jgi:3-dehydroquinate dehydratase-1
MIPSKICNRMPLPSNVVGIIHTFAGLQKALKLSRKDLDFLEIRVDAFSEDPERILPLLPRLKLPLIITVRHPREGGVAKRLSATERRRLFALFLPHAALIDVELRFIRELAPVIKKARQLGIKVIFSHHDFKGTPGSARLHKLALRAKKAEPDLFKMAATTSSPADLATLLVFLYSEKSIPLSIMGMGTFGKISRLLLAQAGSLLNYGFLDKPQLKGQWPATLLKERLKELSAP